jgi:hypothetical protein
LLIDKIAEDSKYETNGRFVDKIISNKPLTMLKTEEKKRFEETMDTSLFPAFSALCSGQEILVIPHTK